MDHSTHLQLWTEKSYPWKRLFGCTGIFIKTHFAIKTDLLLDELLFTLSLVYDLLGLAVPFVLKVKQILQDLYQAKGGWDINIPGEFSKPYEKWLTELDQLKYSQVGRCWKPEDFGQMRTSHLHNFCDANEQGYGTAIYLRFFKSIGEVHFSLVMRKSIVSPLRKMTIPELTLIAATSAVQVVGMLRSGLQLNLLDRKSVCT